MKKFLVAFLVFFLAATTWSTYYWLRSKGADSVPIKMVKDNYASYGYDTIPLFDERVAALKTINGTIKVYASPSIDAHWGEVDSVWALVKTKLDSTWYTVDSQTNAAIPATFQVGVIGNDTLFKPGGLFLILKVVDSVSTTTGPTTAYPVYWDIVVKD